MKALIPLFLLLIFLGCKEISYKEPQPKGKKALQAIPESITGTYLLEDGGESSRDTLIVTKHGYLIASDHKESLLSDSLVLKKYKGYYFVNINERPEWLLRIIRRENNGDLTYMSMDDKDESFNELVRDLSREVGLDSMEVGDEKLYQIDPSPAQLMGLIKKGYFKKTILMKKIQQTRSE